MMTENQIRRSRVESCRDAVCGIETQLRGVEDKKHVGKRANPNQGGEAAGPSLGDGRDRRRHGRCLDDRRVL